MPVAHGSRHGAAGKDAAPRATARGSAGFLPTFGRVARRDERRKPASLAKKIIPPIADAGTTLFVHK